MSQKEMKTHTLLPSPFVPGDASASQVEGPLEPQGPQRPQSQESKAEVCAGVPKKMLFAGLF